MSKLVQGSIVLFATSLLPFACGGSTENTDTGGTNTDRGTIIIPDGGPGEGVTPNTEGGGPQIDRGTTPQQLNCAQVVECAAKCGQTEACLTQCLASGSAEAKSQFQAVDQCLQTVTAAGGDCATQCADPKSQACTDCWSAACKTQIDACMGTGGPPIEGFGDFCDPAAQPTTCPSGLDCIGPEPGKGFCSKQCPTVGMGCGGAPEGTMAACVVKVQPPSGPEIYYCGFICEYSDDSDPPVVHTFDCPSTLTCLTEDPEGQLNCDP